MPHPGADPIALPTGDLEGLIEVIDMNADYQIIGRIGGVSVIWQACRGYCAPTS